MAAMRVGVVLSGCGVYDGSEIHEAVVTLLAIDRAGAGAVCTAPRMPQLHVIDHGTGHPVQGETREVFREAARLARGDIRDLSDFRAADLDALVFPGGFGAAKNLCDFALNGANCTVHPEVSRIILECHRAKLPIGAMCIAPVILAKVLGTHHPLLTIGTDPDTAAALEAMGARHQPCSPDDIVVDRDHRLVTTPAYMTAGSIAAAATGIEKLVQQVTALARP